MRSGVVLPRNVSVSQRHARPRPLRCSCAGYELRICVNKTCKKQGAQQVAKFASDLALPSVAVEQCGCLGSCGAGPNMVLIKQSDSSAAPVMLHHVSTPSQLVEALRVLGNVSVDDALLKVTELRLAGNAAANDGRLQRAVQLYTEALELGVQVGRHLLLSNRSLAHLAAGNAAAAVEDSTAAVACAPADFTTACVRQADALFALQQYAEALAALEAGARRHPPFASSAEYKQLVSHVRKALQQTMKV